MNSKKIKILIAVLVSILLIFITISFFKGSQKTKLISSENFNTTQTSKDKKILGLLLDLNSMKLNTSIFSEKAFQALEDFAVSLPDEKTKRINPFAPIGSDKPESPVLKNPAII